MTQNNNQNQGENYQLCWTFTYRPRNHSLDAALIKYLRNNPIKESKEMALQAMRAFWMALAHSEAGDLDEESLRNLGLHCCNTLETQSDLIRSILGLPPRVMIANHTMMMPPYTMHPLNTQIPPQESPKKPSSQPTKEEFQTFDDSGFD